MDSSNAAEAPLRSWRSSRWLIFFTATLGLFTENFLYGFIVPILPYMIEVRLGLDPSYTQRATTEFLAVLGLVAIPSAPIIGHFADKTPSRKWPLLIALIGCTLGTVLVMTTPSVWAILLGRAFQAVASAGAWIVGFAMLTDSIDQKHLGSTLGYAMSFSTIGVVAGPVVAGFMLEWVGYWPAWAVPLGLIGIGFVARLIIIDSPKSKDNRPDSSMEQARPEETAPLLAPPETTQPDPEPDQKPGQTDTRPSVFSFYLVVLSQPSILAALCVVINFSITVASFDTIFPLYLRDTFGWGSAPTGSLFLALMVPGMFLSPLVGSLRDRYGSKYPTTIGCLLMVPLQWFVGVPGSTDWFGLDRGTNGQAAFVVDMVAIGLVLPLVRGSGAYQLTTTINDLQERRPGIMGPHGGTSRSFSLLEMSFNIGLLLGPVIGGSLAETVGFYYCNCVLAALSFLSATAAFFFMTGRQRTVEEP